ncbi:MAG: deoxyribodipyrimidine photo-lyase [Sphingobacteriia bacterium]|nr:deoxyribodipyrimidine photo-lyase [Sphingobacteriia bacterium]
MNESLTICWLRRDLRLHDHKPLHYASQEGKSFLPIFIFDKEILSRFTNKNDRRLSFIANTIIDLNKELKSYNSEILVFYGRPIEIIPNLCKVLNANKVFAGKDFEPQTIERDSTVEHLLLKNNIELKLSVDHLLQNPKDILKKDGTPFKVFTPFSKAWRMSLIKEDYANYRPNLKRTLPVDSKLKNTIQNAGLNLVNTTSAEKMLKEVGYNFIEDKIWTTHDAKNKLAEWSFNIPKYKETRNYLYLDGTSRLSPYLRFGLISIRECFRYALEYPGAGSDMWINELIWREFYANVLYHFPYTQNLEFLKPLQGKINWQRNEEHFKLWCEGKTGFPVVDAAMRQLKVMGWVHNRARMITASFMCKNLLLDWRLGEEYFAQNLMDYDLASNVGGWQWSASTGTDAQPYFRVFNPILQGQKFDADGIYVKTYVQELKDYKGTNIHEPQKDGLFNKYYEPIVDLDITRKRAIETFKAIK